MTPERTSRRHDLDALRAFAMLLGVGLHAALAYIPFPWPVQDASRNEGFYLLFFAVHGFRMQVFFLLSGFFTAMLWRRHGLRALITHRFKRVFLPLLLGLFTVVPAVNFVSGLASGPEADAKIEAGPFWAAVRSGSVDEVRDHLAAGVDPGAPDKWGITPLHWATGADQPGAVALLIEAGVALDAPDNEGSSPLHWAALFGRTGPARLLLENGADPDLRNKKGDTPASILEGEWSEGLEGIVLYIADLLQLEIDADEVREARPVIRALLGGETVSDSRMPAAGVSKGDHADLEDVLVGLMFVPVFHHLWFLWFLCWLVLVFAGFAWVAGRLPWLRVAPALVLSPARFLWLIPLTLLPQSLMRFSGAMPGFGPDTSAGLLPMPHMLLYYGVFFFYGALLHGADDREGRVGRWWPASLAVGLFVVLPMGLGVSVEMGREMAWLERDWVRPVGMTLEVAYAWLMAFGLMGLFRAVLTSANARIRYVSDASYWIYVFHLPLIIAVQIPMRDWPLGAVTKFALVCAATMGLLLAAYAAFVRYTWIGALLNGRKTRAPQQG